MRAESFENAGLDVFAFAHANVFANVRTAICPVGLDTVKTTMFPFVEPRREGREDLGEDIFDIVFAACFNVHGGGRSVDVGGGLAGHVNVEADAYDNGCAIGVFGVAAFEQHT